MKVTEAVAKRASVRAFKDDPVDTACIKDILLKSSRSPSGGNLQPWRIYVINKKNPKFINIVVAVSTQLPPEDLASVLLFIEKKLVMKGD